jgi:hypothetical protein
MVRKRQLRSRVNYYRRFMIIEKNIKPFIRLEMKEAIDIGREITYLGKKLRKSSPKELILRIYQLKLETRIEIDLFNFVLRSVLAIEV